MQNRLVPHTPEIFYSTTKYIFQKNADHRHLHSFPTRRSSDLTCDDKSAQIYARFDKNDWRIQPAEFYRSAHKDRKSGSAGMPRPISYAVFCLKKKRSLENAAKSVGAALARDI